MKNRSLAIKCSALVFLLYMGMILYILFAVMDLPSLEQFEVAMAYELLGFMTLAYFIFSGLYSNPVKTGFYVPLIISTVAYNLFMNLVTMFLMVCIPGVFFFLIQFVLLLFYTLVAFPFYIFGRR